MISEDENSSDEMFSNSNLKGCNTMILKDKITEIIENELDSFSEILENSDESKLVIKTDLNLYLFIELINYDENENLLSISDVSDYIKLDLSNRIIILNL